MPPSAVPSLGCAAAAAAEVVVVVVVVLVVVVLDHLGQRTKAREGAATGATGATGAEVVVVGFLITPRRPLSSVLRTY